MDETKRQIVEMSNMGISIIIVGVGETNFDLMETLDSDDHVRFKNNNI